MRIKFKLFALLILVCFLSSCAESNSAYDITQYLESFKSMDYEAMYSLTAPMDDIGKQDFIDKYNNIFGEGLKVTEIEIDNLSGPDENGTFTYTATYKTEDYGDFKNDYTLRTGYKKDKCVVLWNYSLIFPEMEEGSSVRIKTLKAIRGEMFGADGSLIAENSYADTIYMDVTKVQDITAVEKALGPITGITHYKLVDKFNSAVEDGIRAVSLGAYPRTGLTEQQRESILAVPGLGIDDEMYTPIRNYPLAEAASHIAGYTSPVDKEDISEGYVNGDRKGMAGLEKAYEPELRGKNGRIVYIENRWGDNVRTLYEDPMQEGQDLRLTIKPWLQQRAHDALNTNLKEGQTGVAIVMDASTGYVEAMASYPSYDDNLFMFPVPDEQLEKMTMFSHATLGLYPPGSVIKPFTATAALENGAVTPDTVFTGKIINDTWTPDDWHWQPIKRISNSGTPLKLSNALIHSDNIYFAFAAMRLGDEKFIEYLRRIGMEEAVDFDLAVSEANIKNEDRVMDRRLLAEMGYGQGELLISPIQLASMYTAFANGTGDMMKPVLVEKTCRTEGNDYVSVTENEPDVWKEGAVSKSSLDTLLPMMKEVIRHGTGYQAKIPGVGLAGKTGTAEINEKREISWFACFWTDGYYKRLVVVMIDAAPDEGPVKFAIAKELLSP
jgi:cell division protein FtsI/penicillin-binding protein 2